MTQVRTERELSLSLAERPPAGVPRVREHIGRSAGKDLRAKAGVASANRPAASAAALHRGRRPRSAWTKRVLCDTVEKVSWRTSAEDDKRSQILAALYEHAVALAEERAGGLPGTARDELVSTVGERVVTGLAKLDVGAPPAQQVSYLDRLLHHALADACRKLDPLGRGPRALRRRYEARVEAAAQARGGLPNASELDSILTDVVGSGRPTLKLLVGSGMHPAEAVARVSGAKQSEEDPGETVLVAMARQRIARAIAAHPDEEVRTYLFKVADGLTARKPANFRRRLGPTLPALIASLVLEDARSSVALGTGGSRR